MLIADTEPPAALLRCLHQEGLRVVVARASAPDAHGPAPPALVVVVAASETRHLRHTLTPWVHAAVPVIVVAAAPSRQLRACAFASGAADVVSWPSDPREMRARIQAVLRHG